MHARQAETIQSVLAALQESDVLLYTSRTVARGVDAAARLEISRAVSAALVEVAAAALAARPGWVIAKGGITAHDVAVRGLGIRRGAVLGQVFSGMVSVLRPDDAPEDIIGMPYVIFAGNVGDDNALADTIALFHGDGHS